MIVRRCLAVVLSISLFHLGKSEGERWSRQVSNSEWIPLTNPRAVQANQVPSSMMGLIPAGGPHLSQLQPLTLPPALQQQYQQQLVQLQKTQESIQKLLLLQQQLRAQQHLLQAQTYLPSGFNTQQDEKQALHQSTIANLQALPELAPEVLLPPVPVQGALPPVYPAQDFLSSNPSLIPQAEKFTRTQQRVQKNNEPSQNDENASRHQPENQEQPRINQSGRNDDEAPRNQDVQEEYRDYTTRQGGHYKNSKQSREHKNQEQYAGQTTSRPSQGDGEEEVQLLYVPAETLAQRGQQQNQRGRNRKLYLQQQHQQQQQQQQEEKNQAVHSSAPSPVQQAFAQQVLHQYQQEQEDRERLQREEREMEIARLKQEQKELDREAQLHQEMVQREKEAARQRELEKIRKEDEIRQAEIDRLAILEQQKELEIQHALEQQRELERQQAEEEARARIQQEAERQAQAHAEVEAHRQALQNQVQAEAEKQAQAEALIRGQQQHLTETTKTRNHRTRGRQRQRVPQNQQNYNSGASTTPSPNQPPLSVYMGSVNPAADPQDVKVSDVLTILKDAKTIAVLDSVGPDAPQVFVGPTNLDPPVGYAKFDLPYLSAIDNNRVERKVDKLPFFVAPLSFNPPPGYSKIPFPAPHIGSVVVNTIDNSVDSDKVHDDVNPSPTPLIEPNAYIENSHSSSATTSYNPQTTPSYSQEVSYGTLTTPKYDTSYSTTSSPGTRYRYRQFYNDNKGSTQFFDENKPATLTSSDSLRDNHSPESFQVTRTQLGQFYNVTEAPTTPNYQSPGISTTPSYQETATVKYENQLSMNGNYRHSQTGLEGVQEEPTREQDLAAQLALINRELTQHREVQGYNNQRQQETPVRNPFHEVDHADVQSKLSVNEQNSKRHRWNDENRESQPNYSIRGQTEDVDEDTRAAVGPTQYSLPAELPPISPQLPGLVNSLLDGNAPAPHTATTITIKTTTTEPSTPTTQRSRGRHRGRIVATRPTTTTVTPPTRAHVNDRSRRPYSRSRSRYTTTEDYAETAYEPKKANYAETTPRVNSNDDRGIQEPTYQNRKAASRHQRFRSRGGDRNAVQAETHQEIIRPQNKNMQNQETTKHEDASLRQSHEQPSAIASNPNIPVYHQEEDYPSSTINPVQNYPTPSSPPIPHDRATAATLANVPNYPEETQGIRYHSGFEASSFGQPNIPPATLGNNGGFDSQAQNIEESHREIIQDTPSSTAATSAEYPFNSDQVGNVNYNVPTSTDDPNARYTHKQNAATYEHPLQVQSNFDSDGLNIQNHFASLNNNQGDAAEHRGNHDHVLASPLYDQVSIDKHDEYAGQDSTTEAPQETTTQPTTTHAPVIIRQRVRTRLSGQNHNRFHQDPAIQTRPRGPQDEYVRFQAINQDSDNPLNSGRPHHNLRIRPRIRVQPSPQVQTDGNDYVRIQAPAQYHRPTTTTTTTTSTTTTQAPKINEQGTNEDDRGTGEEIEYGFIRPPTFQPIHPVDTRYQAATVTYGPVQNQEAATDDVATMEVTAAHAQILRNRQKYHVMNRRPLTKPTTPHPITTQNLPSSTANPEKKLYTVRPKSRPEEQKPPRVRGRIRRPGKKRTTTSTTTESTLESSNELPPDENYPQIIQGSHSDTLSEQQTLHQENLGNSARADSLQHTPAQLHELYQAQENYPRQDFVINFGALPAQGAPREEYDQTQLASTPSRKYNQPTRANSHVADIEGAESQWSTKLTLSSFQPSYSPNHLHADIRPNGDGRRQEKSDDSLEIITAGPEIPSIDILVTSDDKNAETNISEDIISRDSVIDRSREILSTTNPGNATANQSQNTNASENYSTDTTADKKIDSTNVFDVKETSNESFVSNSTEQRSTETIDNAETTIVPSTISTMEESLRSNFETTPDILTTTYSSDGTPEVAGSTNSQSTEFVDMTEPTKTTKKAADPLAVRKTGHRRRRVRIRVRPVDDIVTAESQHISVALNTLVNEKPEYSRFDHDQDLRTTTNVPVPSTVVQTTMEKSLLEDFLDEMLKSSDDQVPIRATSTTTELPSDTTWLTTIETFTAKDDTTPRGMFSTIENEPYTTAVVRTTVDYRKDEEEIKTIDTEDFTATTKHHGFIPRYHKTQMDLFNLFKAADDVQPTKPASEHHRFYPKNHKTKFETVKTTPDEARFLEYTKYSTWNHKDSTGHPKATSESPIAVATDDKHDSAVQTLSDYVKDIFRSIREPENDEKVTGERSLAASGEVKRTLESGTNLEIVKLNDDHRGSGLSDVKTGDTTMEVQPTTVKFSDEDTGAPEEVTGATSNVTDYPDYVDKGETVTTGSEDEKISTEGIKFVSNDSTTISTRSPADSAFSLLTTPEVPVSPDELTTEIPTTVVIPTINSTNSPVGRVLRTSTTTEVSHMTEICYRGRCVKTRPKSEVRMRAR